MANTKISALTAASAGAGTEEFAVNQGGVSKKMTLTQIKAYTDELYAFATATQGAGFATDTYVTASGITVPSGKLIAGTTYRARLMFTKTAAGTAAPTFNLRVGTAGTTADTSRQLLTGGAQTGATDTGFFEILSYFRSIGSGTSAVLVSEASWRHVGTTTGFATSATPVWAGGASGGFDSTVSPLKIGISVNGGASAAWTLQGCLVELFNLAD